VNFGLLWGFFDYFTGVSGCLTFIDDCAYPSDTNNVWGLHAVSTLYLSYDTARYIYAI
jgi:hypothetical protein